MGEQQAFAAVLMTTLSIIASSTPTASPAVSARPDGRVLCVQLRFGLPPGIFSKAFPGTDKWTVSYQQKLGAAKELIFRGDMSPTSCGRWSLPVTEPGAYTFTLDGEGCHLTGKFFVESDKRRKLLRAVGADLSAKVERDRSDWLDEGMGGGQAGFTFWLHPPIRMATYRLHSAPFSVSTHGQTLYPTPQRCFFKELLDCANYLEWRTPAPIYIEIYVPGFIPVIERVQIDASKAHDFQNNKDIDIFFRPSE